jgi:hypothetical protein
LIFSPICCWQKARIWYDIFITAMQNSVMIKRDILAVVFVTCYLVIYVTLLQFSATIYYALAMLALSPALVCAMVFIVLKYGKYNGRPLGNDEYGYQDKNNEGLGVF